MHHATLVHPGSFEPDAHWYPKALNATGHPMVNFFLSLDEQRIVTRYGHLNPLVDREQLRTDASGMLAVPVTHDGVWHMRTIHLVTTDGAPGLTHESNWATLTFEVAHAHAHGHDHDHTHGAHSHTHDEGHDHDHGIPSYVYWLGSLLVIGGLFAYFNRGDA